ncbi:MAG: enoyl-CoA hydratase/isomerase family protein [Planctomycetes bacterium]|nr:enoyl-CoA hydratase/isomerase family protein [Planctomycetota bacterium]
MSGFDAIKIEVDDELGAATIRLNRPDKRNALSGELVDVLSTELDGLRHNDAIRSVFIRGNGPVFCAGADLAEIQGLQTATVHDNQKNSHKLRDFFVKLYSFPKPTIAVVHGAALAGGCGLATCCDFVVATREATFGYPEVKIGFIPAIVMVLLTHQIGERNARDLCLSARTIDADEAHRLGLVTKVVVQADLDATIHAMAKMLHGNAPQAMATVKRMFWRLHEMGTEEALVWASDMNAMARSTDECKEGIGAFLEKRKPKWAQ